MNFENNHQLKTFLIKTSSFDNLSEQEKQTLADIFISESEKMFGCEPNELYAIYNLKKKHNKLCPMPN